MPSYKYRHLDVTIYDKHGGDTQKRRGGNNPDRHCRVDDSAVERPVYFLDQVGDDRPAFLMRAKPGFLAYLNTLGSEGWQVVSYTAPETHTIWYAQFPFVGFYLLTRQTG